MKNFVLWLFLFVFPTLVFASWDLNDVSYLMPLPHQVGTDKLLRLEDSARGGNLLPRTLLAAIPPLTVTMTDQQAEDALRVIAVRLDPCFPLPTPLSCQRQIRMVWQPLEVGRKQQVQTVDAALHSFYVLSDDEFNKLLKEISNWKIKYPVPTEGLPLQVHPAWGAEKDHSPALQEFNKIILKYAGLENLTRVTAMVLRGAGDMWAFQGFEMNDGKLQLAKIPRVQNGSQAFINLAVPADHFLRGQISPEPKSEDSINLIIRNSQRLEEGNEALIRKEVQAALRIENPKFFNPENMDCVSCHVAQPAREWTQRKRSDIGISDLFQNFGYQNSKYNLKNKTQILGNTQIIRAFGYFGHEVSISQRVINESAEVADLVNQWVKISNEESQ
jgi:hypothetical protein